MLLNGRITRIQGQRVELMLDDMPDMDYIDRVSMGLQPAVQIRVDDQRHITNEQRKKAWALIHDISDWSGYSVIEVEQEMKVRYMVATANDYFSMSNCSVETARMFIDVLLVFCFQNDVPFATKTWDMIRGDYRATLLAIRRRECVICGRHADIAHDEAVGMGRNRRKISHAGYKFLPLCQEHHDEEHTIGMMPFYQKYQVKPIKLSNADRKKLNIGG